MAQGKIAVMGAGAVGCCYGALLAQGGEDVTLIGRPALAEAVAERGLIFEKDGRRDALPLAAASSPEALGEAGIVLFAVKSGDTEGAGRAMAPHLRPDALVFSLQNGIGNAERLAAVLGRPVVPVVIYIAAEMAGPGHVRHNGRGELIFPPGPASEAVVPRLRAAGLAAEISPQAETAMWVKFTVNCCVNALSALTRQNYGRIVAEPGAEQLLRDTLAECVAVATASGVALPEDLWATVRGVCIGMAGQNSSTAQDLRRGRRTEIDYLNGEVVRRAAALGIPVPVNNALWVMVKLAEAAG